MESHRTTDAAHTLRQDIEAGLRRRTTPENTKARTVEDWAKRGGAVVWKVLKDHSYTSILGVGALGVLLAEAVGIGELAVGAALAYGAFGVLRRGEAPSQAAQDVIKDLEHA